MFFFMKYRKKFDLDNDIINYLKNMCFEIGKRYRFDFDAVGNDSDLVHIVASAEPKYSSSILMRIIKRITAKKSLQNILRSKKLFGC